MMTTVTTVLYRVSDSLKDLISGDLDNGLAGFFPVSDTRSSRLRAESVAHGLWQTRSFDLTPAAIPAAPAFVY